jgi:hypothetical protein
MASARGQRCSATVLVQPWAQSYSLLCYRNKDDADDNQDSPITRDNFSMLSDIDGPAPNECSLHHYSLACSIARLKQFLPILLRHTTSNGFAGPLLLLNMNYCQFVHAPLCIYKERYPPRKRLYCWHCWRSDNSTTSQLQGTGREHC